MPLHVYGVVNAGIELPELTGVGSPGAPLDLVTEQELAAVVSELADPEDLTGDDAITHFDVLAAIAATDTVLPLRFGTSAPDANAVRAEVLAGAAPLWQERLAALDGLVELRVDFDFDEQQVLREVVAKQPHLREAHGAEMSERIRVGEAVSEAVSNRVRERGEELIAPLTELAERTVPLDGPEPTCSRWALLAARERVADFDRAMRTMAPGVEVRYVGPLPAYDFPDETPAESTVGNRWGW